MRGRRFGTGAAIAVALGMALPLSVFAEWSSYSAPFTGATDFATGFTTCGGDGPTGLLFDGSHLFISDFCDPGTLYRFSTSGGDVTAAQASNSNGIDLGLATSGGGYFGAVDHSNDGAGGGVYRFDPVTLARGTQLFSTGRGVRDIVADPLTGDLYFSSIQDGIYRMTAPNSTTPVVTLFVSGDFDGLTWSSDGTTLYAANFGNKHINAFNRTGTQVLDVDPAHPVDGLAYDSNTGDVYANTNDGDVVRMDGQTHATSVVASGGSRGDLARLGPDGCMYATQTAVVAKLLPCFAQAPQGLPEAASPLLVVGSGAVAAIAGGAVMRRRRRTRAAA